MRWLTALLFVLGLSFAPAVQAQSWTAAPAVEEGPALPAIPPDWITVPGTFLRVHGDEAQTRVLLRVARHGSEVLPELASALQVPIGTTIHVYVAESDAEFRALQPGRPPTWADATAWPKLGAVFLRAPQARMGGDEPLEQVLEHELVHILLGRAFAPATPPSWLQEGVAQVLADQLGPDDAETLTNGTMLGGLLGLEALEHGFPADPNRARLAYAESADFVAYLMSTHGPDALPALIRASAGGDTMRQAVYASTGVFLEDLETDWKERHEDRLSQSLAVLGSGEWVWALGALALVVGGVQRRRQFHRRLAEMEEEERVVDELLASLRQQRATA